MTQQKRVILEEVRNHGKHPTADEVYAAVRQRLPRISLGTVYRNLGRLSRDGLIDVIESAGSRRYDGDLKEHSHIRCAVCGKISDTERPPGVSTENLPWLADGFLITGYRIEYSGVCGDCRKETGSREPG